MSVSVDDLVASLSANHIGQEATDLAALQAQLAQTLFTQQLSLSPTHTSSFVHGASVNITRRDPTSVQHCTTPTARTPSSATFAWPLPVPEHVDHSRKRSASIAWIQGTDDGWCEFEEMDEERTVEDMITPDSPRPSNTPLRSSYKMDAHGSATRVFPAAGSNTITAPSMSSPTDSCASSLFASTDPFYLQASQSAQQSHTSFFGHVGRPTSHSPFMMGVPSWE